MDFNEYDARQARITEAFDYDCVNDQIEANLLGLVEEVGEVARLFRKAKQGGYSLDEELLKSELGDVLSCVSCLVASYGVTLELIAINNCEKLESRFLRGTLQNSGDDR